MLGTMTPELYWLVLTVLMTSLFWVPYISNRIHEYGPLNALTDPQGRADTKVFWADRMMKAHRNAVENLVTFAPLVLALYVVGISTRTTAIACMVFFFARAAHYIVYTLGVPVLRTVAFAIGFGAQTVLALVLLHAI